MGKGFTPTRAVAAAPAVSLCFLLADIRRKFEAPCIPHACFLAIVYFLPLHTKPAPSPQVFFYLLHVPSFSKPVATV